MAVEDDTPKTPATRSSIQVIDRTVAMLRAIAEAGGNGLALKDITAAAGLRPSTGRTLLSALAGLVRPARARVDLDGRTLDDTSAEPARMDLSRAVSLSEVWPPAPWPRAAQSGSPNQEEAPETPHDHANPPR